MYCCRAFGRLFNHIDCGCPPHHRHLLLRCSNLRLLERLREWHPPSTVAGSQSPIIVVVHSLRSQRAGSHRPLSRFPHHYHVSSFPLRLHVAVHGQERLQQHHFLK